MVIAEALVLLTIGLLLGIFSTVFDVVVFGCACILSHFTLWVLLNALLAVHIESRSRAIWWAIPFNIGFFGAYFLTTVASFESYPKSMVVTLVCVAFTSPFLTYAVWVAKREKNFYGYFLSTLVVIGALVSSYLINKSVGVYDIVVGVLIALVLFVMPVRRLRISRTEHPVTEGVIEEKPRRRKAKRTSTEPSSAETEAPTRRAAEPKRRRVPKLGRRADAESEQNTRKRPKKNARKRKPFGWGQAAREDEDAKREERRRARRARRERQDAPVNEPATLGNARAARRSSRSA